MGKGTHSPPREDLLNRPSFCFSLHCSYGTQRWSKPLDTEGMAPSVLNRTLPIETPPPRLQHLPHSFSLLPAASSLNWPPSSSAAPHGCFQITVLSAAHILLSSTRSQLRVFGECLYSFSCFQLSLLLQSRKSSSKLHFPTEVCNQAGF